MPDRPYGNVLEERTVDLATGEVVAGSERYYAENEVVAVYVMQTAPTGWVQVETHYRVGEPRLEWVPAAGVPSDAVPKPD